MARKAPAKPANQHQLDLRPFVRLLARSTARQARNNLLGETSTDIGCNTQKAYPLELDEYLTIREAARRVRVNDRTVRNWIKNGQLAAKRIGGVVRIGRLELERAIKPKI